MAAYHAGHQSPHIIASVFMLLMLSLGLTIQIFPLQNKKNCMTISNAENLPAAG